MSGFFQLLAPAPKPHETPIIRFSPDLRSPISQLSGLDTPSALFTRAVSTHGDKRSLAFRKVIAHVLDTRLLGDWQYLTYAEVGQRVKELGAGLRRVLTGRKVQRLHMAAAGSANWFMLSHAAAMASVELVCINPRIGQRELTHTLTYVPAMAVFIEGRHVARLLTPLVECPQVRLVVYDVNSEVEADLEAVETMVRSLMMGLGGLVRVVSVEELRRSGREVLADFALETGTKEAPAVWGHLYARTLNEFELPVPDTVTHGTIAAGFAGMHYALQQALGKDDTYLSYLPLYLRLEYNLVNALFMSGITIGFGTEVDSFLLSAPYNPQVHSASYGDIQSFSPSILFGIKPWWDVIHGKLLKAVAARPTTEQTEFWKWLEKKRDVVAGRLPVTPLVPLSHMFEKWGRIAEIRSTFFGDSIRWIGVTCAMMTPEKRELLGLVFGGPKGVMVEGWVLPHMNSDITFMPPQYHARIGLGRPFPSVEVKLVSTVDENTNRWRNIHRGHIHVRGPSLTRGGKDWIKTNRVGEWNASTNSLRVVGNMLEPLTTRHLGEYVPLERLEATYKQVPYVLECVLVNSWKSVPLIAIIRTEEAALREFSEPLGVVPPDSTAEELLRLRPLKQEIVRHLREYGKRHGLVAFELVAGLAMAFEQWDKRMRLLDGTLDRERILMKYSEEVEEEARWLQDEPEES